MKWTEDWNRIYALWDELADFPAAQSDQACRRLLETIASWIGADNAAWAGVLRVEHGPAARKDPLSGWRARVAINLLPATPEQERRLQQLLKEQHIETCLACCATARLAGDFRVHRMRDGFVDFRAMQRSRHFQVLHEIFGLDDRIWVGFPVSADTESFFHFDKCHSRKRFRAEDAELAARTLRGLKWLHRQLLLSHGVFLAETPLSPIQRRIAHLLLTERSEKEIAGELGQSFHTTHTHVKEIFRRYGVKGRTALMAMWLNR